MNRNGRDVSLTDRPLCNAPTKHGGLCQSRAMRNSTRCRSHGGRTPAAIDAARVRAMMAADPLVAEVHKIAMDAKQPPNVRVEALKLAIKLTGAFEGKQSVELSVLGAPKAMTFEDLVGSALIDVAETDEGDLYVEYRDGTSKLVPRASLDDRTGIFMDVGWDADDEPLALPAAHSEDIVDAEVVEEWHEPVQTKYDRAAFAEADRQRRAPAQRTSEDRARIEAELMRRHERGEEITDDDVMSPPDKFGVRHDRSAQRRAEAMSAAARRSADKTVRLDRSTSTADPHADRVGERSGRRSMSPKRWEQRQRDGGEG